MTLLYNDPRFQAHETGTHPETPNRLVSVASYLAEFAPSHRCVTLPPVAASQEQIRAVHAGPQLDTASRTCAAGGGYLDPDTPVSPESFDISLLAAGTALDAVNRVARGEAPNALCLLRPPGHHATQDRSMGFCVFNNIAVAATYALTHLGMSRILIVDWDVHHGNGTQDIFYDSEQVTFFSIHRYPFYPGSGAESETGTGRGLGSTINVPVAFGTPRRTYLEMFRRGLERALSRGKPDLILISAGFDAHVLDPIGNLGLQTEDYGTLTDIVTEAAAHYCQGRVVSCLEGGYHLHALAESAGRHLEHLLTAAERLGSFGANRPPDDPG